MASPIRKGKPTVLSLDPDAIEVMRSLVPNTRGQGLWISELIRGELLRREARREERERLARLLTGHLE